VAVWKDKNGHGVEAHIRKGLMKIIAHRGARAEKPDNTLRAIKRAFECSADGVEIDVRLSKDHEIVVIHDDTLERTTNGFGKVGEKTLEQLRTLDAGKGEKIPRFSEVLLLCENVGLELVVELKEVGMEEIVVHEVIEAGMEESVIISSFYHASLLKIKKGIGIYPWTINTREDLEKALELGVEGVVTDNPCRLKVFLVNDIHSGTPVE